ncbi:MAG: SGNH/GDSL hydrolase family protein [Planctomycetaceae bacterium]|nr:SGNH/GDSL hydrolase family protein [Planctomycetaceae bacterium]
MPRTISCRFVFAFALTCFAPFVAQAADVPHTTFPKSNLKWYDAKDLDVEGRAFNDTKAYYDRLPGKAEGVVPDPVWSLSRQSAGMCVRFAADTPAIVVRWKLTSPTVALPHMAATGVSGVDLYGLTDEGVWRWIAVGKALKQENEQKLVSTLPPGLREYRVYLPLYNGTESVHIGLAASAKIARSADPALKKKPVVFYGTSIMHGACASRTGMAQSSIIGRRIGRPVVNLGFSGNGRMEPALAQLLAEIDADCYVLDTLPNMEAKLVKERAEAFVLALRKAKPNVPIVLVEDRTYADGYWVPSRRERNEGSRKEFKAAYKRLLDAGVTGLTYVEGDQLLRADGEDTVDGSHPTDLGFMRYADVLTPIIKPLLKD